MIKELLSIGRRALRQSYLATVAAIGGLLLFSGVAQANTYNLTIDHCTGGCSNGFSPFGTVSVTQNGANLDFSITLNSTYVFQKSTGLDAFTFGFTGDPAITITGLTAGFSVDSNLPVHQDGFGTFDYGILNAATGGQALSFTVANEILANLILSTGGSPSVLFSADISGNGNTGAVGSSAAVPGPLAGAGLPGLLAACAGLLLLARRRRQQVA